MGNAIVHGFIDGVLEGLPSAILMVIGASIFGAIRRAVKGEEPSETTETQDEKAIEDES